MYIRIMLLLNLIMLAIALNLHDKVWISISALGFIASIATLVLESKKLQTTVSS